MNKKKSLPNGVNYFNDLLIKKDFILYKKIDKGHAGCSIYIVTDTHKNKHVVKYGETADAIQEVHNNLDGYKRILDAYDGLLVPKQIELVSNENFSCIIMPYLNQNITEKVREDNFDDWSKFWSSITSSVKKTIKDDSNQETGIHEYINNIEKWFNIIDNSPFDSFNLNFKNIKQSSFITYGDKSSIMLQDFTPDNTFFEEENVVMIDPWPQSTFTGSFLPSIGQFRVIYEEIYKLPINENYIKYSEDSIQKIIDALNLPQEIARNQLKLGEAMQYILSSYVRIDSHPIKSLKFKNKAMELLSGLMV